jgi:glycosyltransferase involved in cell wall biosynthesis
LRYFTEKIASSYVRLVDRCLSITAKDYTRLFIVSDAAGWVLTHEAEELMTVCNSIDISATITSQPDSARNQCIFHHDRYFLLNRAWQRGNNRLALAYYHGIPGTGYPEFDQCYEAFRASHECISRVQVSNKEMQKIILATGIAPGKVFLIPIGINLDYFPFRDSAGQSAARLKWGIPQSAFVVGSFQKDGAGWGDGDEPKLVKGPDVFLETMRMIKGTVPELFVLLSGPSRGYVKRGLEKIGIPFRHVYLNTYIEMGSLYQSLDLYLVTSRQEGGPKAVLESMATGVPLVSTRVGQAVDLIEHGRNGWLAQVADSEGLAFAVQQVYEQHSHLGQVLYDARCTAENTAYPALHGMWLEFMEGFVNS